MHIPDGMLQASTWIPAWLGSAGALALATREVRARLSDGTIVMMAVLAALIFALQMLNFPVAGGTSGHFAGGAAAAIVLGLWPAMLVMAAVVAVQALFFADGGITTLGANMLTMAIIGPLVGYACYRSCHISDDRAARRPRPPSRRRGQRASQRRLAPASCSGSRAGRRLAPCSRRWASGTRSSVWEKVRSRQAWSAICWRSAPTCCPNETGGRPIVGRSAPSRSDSARLHSRPSASLSSPPRAPTGSESVYGRLGETFESAPVIGGAMPDYVMPGVTSDTLAGVLAGLVGAVMTGVLVYALLTTARARRAGRAE